MNMKDEIKSLDSREHILIRPNMYIGSVTNQKFSEYIDGKLQEISYIPGLVKIINEIIDNSVDIGIKTNFKKCSEISVKITHDYVEVVDDGPGIPVTKNNKGEYLPKVCWGTALSGSNFSDENRTQMGMNGVGSYCTNVWSKKFVGISDDGKNKYTISFKDNAKTFTEKLDKSSKHGVTVKFYPDLERFKTPEISETVMKVIQQRLINLNMCFPKLKFKFNGKAININSFKKYVQTFGENFELFETDRYQFAILPSTSDEFQQFSFVNGLKIPEGGTHIDVISNQIVTRLRDKLCKKYKTLKPADIKNKLMIIAFLRDFPSPMFNSQTKEKLTNSTAELTDYYNGDCDYDKLSNKILKNDALIDPIVEVFKIKEEFKKRQELKSLGTVKKRIKNEKYTPSIGDNNYLLITEGFSAYSGLSKILGRKGLGYYQLKGKPLNSWTCTHQKFMANEELAGLYQVIKNEEYKHIVVASDQDLDGYHIRGLIATFIKKYLPEEIDKLGFLQTPVIVYTKGGKVTSWTYNLSEKKELVKGEVSDYKKGLGSWNPDELKEVIKKDGFEKMIQKVEFDEDSTSCIDDWFGNDSEPRKKYIVDNDFSIASA